jgi:hypothetical protein
MMPVFRTWASSGRDSMGQHHRQRQEFIRFAARISIYDALVTGAKLIRYTIYSLAARTIQAISRTAFDSIRDIRALIMGDDLDLIPAVIADISHGFADNMGYIGDYFGSNLTGDGDLPGSRQHFTGDAGTGIISQTVIQHAVGDKIAELVRMPFGNRFGGQDFIFFHGYLSFCCL